MEYRNKVSLKINRVLNTIFYNNPDMVPIQDLFFWDNFIENWKKYYLLDDDTDIFEYYDLDIVCCSPNIDPKIENVVEISRSKSYVVYRGGFGSTLKLDFSQPIPIFIDYAVKEVKELKKFSFEEPGDQRRYYKSFAPPDQYNLQPSFAEQVEKYRNNFCIFGNICEARETTWRILGLENELIAINNYPRELAAFAERAADFNIELGAIQLENEYISGLMVYGDIAYSRGLFMSPQKWRTVYRPSLERMCSVLKKYNKPLIYHTDGCYLDILDDLVEIGFDAVHPNEAKAGIDVVKLKGKMKNKIAFLGNINAISLSGSREEIKRELEYKFSATKGGGYLPGGDDVPASVSPENYDYYIDILKELRGKN